MACCIVAVQCVNGCNTFVSTVVDDLAIDCIMCISYRIK